jgi:hypothetical protein
MYTIFVSHRKQICRPARPVTGIALLFLCRRYSYLTENKVAGLHGLLRVELYYSYVDDVRTSQETKLPASTNFYEDSFIFFNSSMQKCIPGYSSGRTQLGADCCALAKT